uniref:hypothetical protein n=1 Tax=Chlorobotrys sp. TaxID=2859677 RepID=UPI00218224A1|nr:hypothetical protein N4K87_pgp083 [Chlorobotrys sp.]UVI60834.1 hypothetical protein [Chlorobotrys sp.]
MKSLFPYLQLMRPANIITAMTNVASGFIASSYFLNTTKFLDYNNLGYLLIVTIGLYGGGVVFNDFFDSDIDAYERPNRPIPSGAVKKSHALILGSVLFISALLVAFKMSVPGFIISIIICLLCFVYNTKTKHKGWLGGITLGLCRGLNLLLGTTTIHSGIVNLWPLSFIPFGLTVAITSISQVEVEGASRIKLLSSIWFFLLTLLTFIVLIDFYGNLFKTSFLFLGLFISINFFYLYNALQNPIPINVQKVVKWGVLSFIVLDAAIISSFSNFYSGFITLCLLPVCITLSKFFAVT